MEIWIRNAYFVSQGANPYASFMPPVPGLSFAYLQVDLPSVGYLPLWSILVAGLYRAYSFLPQSNRFVFYFLVKQPTILADLYLGRLIFVAAERWGASRHVATKLLQYWMFLPYAIIITAIWGQFDSIVAALFLLFLLARPQAQRLLFLGVGVTLKWFPVIFVPFYAIRDRLFRRGITVLALAVPVGITALIFTVMRWDYAGVTNMATSVSHGGGGGMGYLGLLQSPLIVPFLVSQPVLFGVLGYLWVPGIIVAAYAASRRFASGNPPELIQAVMFVIVVFYLTRWGVNEQYLMYLFPLFLIDTAVWHPERRALYSLLSLLTLCFVLVNNDLLVRFLGPVSTQFVDIAYAADASPDLGIIRGIALYALSILFSVTCVQFAWVLLKPGFDTRPWPLTLKAKISRVIANRWAKSRPQS